MLVLLLISTVTLGQSLPFSVKHGRMGEYAKNCESSAMSPCHSFMDAGGRHKTTGSETKDRLLFTAVAVARVSAFSYAGFLSPSLHRVE